MHYDMQAPSTQEFTGCERCASAICQRIASSLCSQRICVPYSVLQCDTDLRQVGDSQHKADGVQNVGLPTAIETSDGVEERIKIGHGHSRGVRLEAVESNLFYIHLVADVWEVFSRHVIACCLLYAQRMDSFVERF